jgi:hypothetical protein
MKYSFFKLDSDRFRPESPIFSNTISMLAKHVSLYCFGKSRQDVSSLQFSKLATFFSCKNFIEPC